jgi:hypothetical protein
MTNLIFTSQIGEIRDKIVRKSKFLGLIKGQIEEIHN